MKRRTSVALLAAMVVLSFVVTAWCATTTRITGHVAVGQTRYTVRGKVSSTHAGEGLRLRLIVASGLDVVRAIKLVVSRAGGEVEWDDTRRPVSPDAARRYLTDWASAFWTLTDRFRFTQTRLPEGLLTLDSSGQVVISPGIEGRLRLRYGCQDDESASLSYHPAGCRLLGVDFFSLAEWHNVLGDYVSLTLDLEEREP